MDLDFFKQAAAQESRSCDSTIGRSQPPPWRSARCMNDSAFVAGLVFNIASSQQAKGRERNGASAARAERVRIGCYSRKVPVIEHTDGAAVTAVIHDVGSTDIPSTIRIHPVFRVSQLEPEDPNTFEDRNHPPPPHLSSTDNPNI